MKPIKIWIIVEVSSGGIVAPRAFRSHEEAERALGRFIEKHADTAREDFGIDNLRDHFRIESIEGVVIEINVASRDNPEDN